MAKIIKTKELYLNVQSGNFVYRFVGRAQENFSDIASLRNLLTKEKARILNTLKTKKPESIYQLAKILKRDFKSVYQDLKALEKFNLIELQKSKSKKSITPILAIDKINFVLNI